MPHLGSDDYKTFESKALTYGQFGSTQKIVVVVVDVGNVEECVEEGGEEVGLIEGLTEGFSVEFMFG